MQTKSPLVRIAVVAGVPLAVLALFLLVHMQHRAHSSQPVASNHTAASTQPATALTATDDTMPSGARRCGSCVSSLTCAAAS